LVAVLAIVTIGVGTLILDSRARTARIDACVQKLPEGRRQLEAARQQCEALENSGALERAEKG